ncbi:MAG TPA: branched-chain amino acid ABC transporter permease, partial [Gammaproteobacteria bacterium]|nr:branched-chain amino acid ABC transporter permease [Gammaproteobacteria bacterium]
MQGNRGAVQASNYGLWKSLVLAVCLVIYLIVLPAYFAESRYVLRVITTASVLSFISLGVWLTFTIGRINIGQGAFALIGGYTTAILSTKLGVS